MDIDKFVESLDNDKSKSILRGIVAGLADDMEYSFRVLERSFRAYGRRTDQHIKFCSPERHLLNMFKIMYSVHSIVRIELLPLVTAIYLLRTKESLVRPPKSEIKSNSIFAKTVGLNEFNIAVRVFRSVYKHLKPSNPVPVDSETGMMISIYAAGLTSQKPGESVFRVSQDSAISKRFDECVMRRHKAFEVKSGILYPTPDKYIRTSEDL